jgi:phosphohistidine phosphatase
MHMLIIRHGPAEDLSPTGLDSDRALTPKGRERVRHVARELVRLGEAPKVIITSPLVRAVQTARILQEEAGIKEGAFEEHAWLGMQGRARELVDELVAKGEGDCALVGHEPELSQLVKELTGASVHMEKAMVVGVAFDKGKSAKSRLRFVLEPKTLDLKRA